MISLLGSRSQGQVRGGDRPQGLFRRRFHIVISLAISPEAGVRVFCFSVPVVLTNFRSIQTPWHQGSVLCACLGTNASG